tara:strand:- start:278 stop:778 length:501 start_codon:yes stop_codon:yes gene_type:complete
LPYSYSIFKNARRNVPLICALIFKKIIKLLNLNYTNILNLPLKVVFKRSYEFSLSLYEKSEIVKLLQMISHNFKNFVKDNGAIPIFLFVPYLQDLHYIKRNNYYYKDFFELINKEMFAIDITEDLLKCSKPESLYVSPFHGEHFNDKGNKFVADCIYNYLKKEILI